MTSSFLTSTSIKNPPAQKNDTSSAADLDGIAKPNSCHFPSDEWRPLPIMYVTWQKCFFSSFLELGSTAFLSFSLSTTHDPPPDFQVVRLLPRLSAIVQSTLYDVHYRAQGGFLACTTLIQQGLKSKMMPTEYCTTASRHTRASGIPRQSFNGIVPSVPRHDCHAIHLAADHCHRKPPCMLHHDGPGIANQLQHHAVLRLVIRDTGNGRMSSMASSATNRSPGGAVATNW